MNPQKFNKSQAQKNMHRTSLHLLLIELLKTYIIYLSCVTNPPTLSDLKHGLLPENF